MSEHDIIEYEPRQLTLGALPVQGPTEIIQRASEVASALAQIVEKQKLYTPISGKKFVRVEGWNTLGAMLGILPREVPERTHRVEVDGNPGYEAFVELLNPNNGAIVGGASAICTRGERNWEKRDDYAIRSMAVTRATGKAFRLGFSWIMALAGYEPTPAEEMPEDGQKPTKKTARKATNSNGNGDKPHWIDCVTEDGQSIRARFWKWAKQDMGLEEAEVYTALEVEKIHDFQGDMQAARAKITEWQTKQQALEAAHEEGDGE